MKLLPIALGAALASPVFAAPPGAADTSAVAESGGTHYELLVVGVYRPLDLEGRTIVEPREVYLQSVDVPQGPLAALIGRDLEVTRRVPVPAAVSMQPQPTQPQPMQPQPTQPQPSAPEIDHPAPEPVPAPTVPTPVGRLQVTAVRGDVVVARVMHDGVESAMHPEAEKPDGRPDLPAIMAGDMARYIEPPPPPPKPPPLSADEKARLAAEQERLERDDARRKARPKPYERPVMRWKL